MVLRGVTYFPPRPVTVEPNDRREAAQLYRSHSDLSATTHPGGASMLKWANRAVQVAAVVAVGWFMVTRLQGDDVPPALIVTVSGLVVLAAGMELLVARRSSSDDPQ